MRVLYLKRGRVRLIINDEEEGEEVVRLYKESNRRENKNPRISKRHGFLFYLEDILFFRRWRFVTSEEEQSELNLSLQRFLLRRLGGQIVDVGSRFWPGPQFGIQEKAQSGKRAR